MKFLKKWLNQTACYLLCQIPITLNLPPSSLPFLLPPKRSINLSPLSFFYYAAAAAAAASVDKSRLRKLLVCFLKEIDVDHFLDHWMAGAQRLRIRIYGGGCHPRDRRHRPYSHCHRSLLSLSLSLSLYPSFILYYFERVS